MSIWHWLNRLTFWFTGEPGVCEVCKQFSVSSRCYICDRLICETCQSARTRARSFCRECY